MKNTILKTIGTMLPILMLTVFAQISVSAQDDIINAEKGDEQTQAEDAATRRENSRRLEGAWNIQQTPRNCQTGEPLGTSRSVMFTFIRGAAMYDSGSLNSPSLRGAGHGAWRYQSNRRYTAAFQFFRFNADGTHAGRSIVRLQIELSRDGNSYTTVGMGQIHDATATSFRPIARPEQPRALNKWRRQPPDSEKERKSCLSESGVFPICQRLYPPE